MSIRHAILGLLAEQPMHGYRLKMAFDARLSGLWGLTTGQIYQCLAGLETAGLLKSRGERSGRRPARRVYELTEAGRQELSRWLGDVRCGAMPPFRDETLIRLMFLREGEAPALWASLVHRERQATRLLARVAETRAQRRPDPADLDLPGLFLDGLSDRLRADVETLRRCRAEVERWARRRGVSLDAPNPSSTTNAPLAPGRSRLGLARRGPRRGVA